MATNAGSAIAPGGQLPMRRTLALAGTDYGVNLAWHSIELFLLFFYTDVAGLPPVFAGLVLTMGSIWDALIDPVIGSMADRTRTRWGRFRPWVVGSGPLMGVGLALTFYKPPLEGAALAIFALVAHLLFRTAYTMGTIPFIGLTARVTHDAGDRARISALRMVFAGLASLTVAFSYPLIRGLFPPEQAATGFLVAAALLGAVIPLVFFAAMSQTVEPVDDTPPQAAHRRTFRQAVAEDGRAFKMLVRHNGSFVRVLLATMLVSSAGTLVYKTALYYYKYYAQAPELAQYGLAMSAVAQLALAPLWALLANRTSKRTGWFAAACVGFVGLGGLAIIPTGQPYLALGLFFLFGASNVGLSVMFWSMIPDTVEVNELTFGDRFEAKTVGLALFARKMTLAFDAMLVGVILEVAGFAANQAQSTDALSAIRLLIGGIPMGCLLLSIVVLWRYKLDGREHARLRAAIALRREEMLRGSGATP